MLKLILALLPLALMVNCKAANEKAEAQTPPVAQQKKSQTPSNAEFQNQEPGDPLSPFEKDGSVKSSFPPGAVLRLNAIVSRSKDAIDRFDKLRPGMQAAIDAAKAAPANTATMAKAKAAIAELDALHGEAAAAKAALADEGNELLKTGRYYDNVIFSGMSMFVSKVEDELADEKKAVMEALPQ